MIPRVAHFVFGLEPQVEPFHVLHYVALESCRVTLEPETIVFHCRHEPHGEWWDRIRPHVELVHVELVPEVLAVDYSEGHVPEDYRYAHHADFIRLDALIEHGGIYADIDTIFVRPLPDELYASPFVLGREPAVRDEQTGEVRQSLCNAFLMAEKGAAFARAWRQEMPGRLNGTWSNHSGFLAQELSERMPAAVRVEPEPTFYPFPGTVAGLARLLEERHAVPSAACSVHLWAHLWWDDGRTDFTDVGAGSCTPAALERGRTTLADLTRAYLMPRRRVPSERWTYASLDGYWGYAVAARRCIAALEDDGLELDWAPVVGPDFELAEPPEDNPVVVAHLVPEAYPQLRKRYPDAFLVGHTVWETTRLPEPWPELLEQADLLVVPSQFSAEPFQRARLDVPLAVVPHVAPAVQARERPWLAVPPETFVAYTVGEWTERKGVAKTVEAYLRAFAGRQDVLLVVKTSPQDFCTRSPRAGAAGPGSTAWALARLLAQHRDPPPVRLVTRDLTERELAALHRRGDCFVSLARSEGWGLGAFDAACYGNPVVTTRFGGQLEFLDGSPWLVDFELVPTVDPTFASYTPDQQWAEPDVDHAAALLRRIAAAPRDATAIAAATAPDLLRRYSPDAVATAFRAAVAEARAAR